MFCELFPVQVNLRAHRRAAKFQIYFLITAHLRRYKSPYISSRAAVIIVAAVLSVHCVVRMRQCDSFPGFRQGGGHRCCFGEFPVIVYDLCRSQVFAPSVIVCRFLSASFQGRQNALPRELPRTAQPRERCCRESGSSASRCPAVSQLLRILSR